jgi:ubiquinone/menaquinone biosynthesis C-methylase UbiE
MPNPPKTPPPDSSLRELVVHGDNVRDEADLVQYQGWIRPGGRIVLEAPTRRHRRWFPHYFDVLDLSRERLEGRRRPSTTVAHHFEELAHEYSHELPAHIQEHFLAKKLQRILRATPHGRNLRILDLGCGLGDYAKAVASATDAHVVAVDVARNNLRLARQRAGPANRLDHARVDALRLPFRDATFDLIYTINVLHHLKRGEQERALRGLARLLRPQGRLVVLEINISNPLFRFYMRRIFPRTRRIDRGDEEFIPTRRWPLVEELRLVRLEHFTFAPDFVPRWALRPIERVEAWLENSKLRSHAIHYAAVLAARKRPPSRRTKRRHRQA